MVWEIPAMWFTKTVGVGVALSRTTRKRAVHPAMFSRVVGPVQQKLLKSLAAVACSMDCCCIIVYPELTAQW